MSPRACVFLFAAVLPAATALAQADLAKLDGAAVGGQFGTAVAGAGDVDQDGFDDLIVAAPLEDSPLVDAGRIRILAGRDGATLVTVSGNAAGQRLGAALTVAGDTNGDGMLDFVAGAPGTAGAIVFDAGGTVLRSVVSAAAGGFGSVATGGGDLNGDGFDDLAVGAPMEAGKGVAHAYSGFDGSSLFVVAGDVANAACGQGLAIGGDFDQDGRADLVVGSPGFSWGLVRVHSGATGAGLLTVLGNVPDPFDPFPGQFGWSVATIENGGVPDLLIGANEDGGSEQFAFSGRLYAGATGALKQVFKGTSSTVFPPVPTRVAVIGDATGDGLPEIAIARSTANHPILVFDTTSATPLFGVKPDPQPASFGSSFAAAGDVNGDGRADLIAGAPQDGFLGSAFEFTLACASVQYYGIGCSGGASVVPSFTLQGCFSPGAEAIVRIKDAIGADLALIFAGTTSTSIAAGYGCTLLVVPLATPFPLAIGPTGALLLDVEIPIDFPPGGFVLQSFFTGPGIPKGVAASRGIAVSAP